MRWLAGVAAIIAAAVDILYVGIVINQSNQGPHDRLGSTVIFVATFIAVLAVSAALAALGSAALRPAFLGLSALGLLAIGFVAIFSIGLPLLLAGGLAFVALLFSLRESRQPAGILKAGAGALLAVAIFVGGFESTVRAIACPATGIETGSGSGIVSGPYHYTCVDGKLTVVSG